MHGTRGVAVVRRQQIENLSRALTVWLSGLGIARKVKGRQFDSRSGHVAVLQVQSLAWVRMGGN